jgi:hypothetical protein
MSFKDEGFWQAFAAQVSKDNIRRGRNNWTASVLRQAHEEAQVIFGDIDWDEFVNMIQCQYEQSIRDMTNRKRKKFFANTQNAQMTENSWK